MKVKNCLSNFCMFIRILSESISVSKLFFTFTILLLLSMLMGLQIPFSIGGIQTSLYECVAITVFSFSIISTKCHKSKLWKPYLLLLIISFVPLIIGCYKYGFQPAFRSYAWIIYISSFFLGYHLDTNSKKGSVLLNILFGVTVTLVSFALISQRFPITIIYNFRLYALCSILFFLYLLLCKNTGILKRFLLIISILVLFVFLIGLRTRAFYIGLFISVLLFMILALKTNPNFGKIFAVALVVSIIGLYLFAGRISIFESRKDFFFKRMLTLSSIDTILQDTTASGRLIMWRIVWEKFMQDKIIGVGFGDYLRFDPEIFGKYPGYEKAIYGQDYAPLMMHNSWLEILYSGGILLSLAFSFIIYSLLRILMKGYYQAKENKTKLYLAFFISTICGYCIVAFFGCWFSTARGAIPFWIVSGIGVRTAEYVINQGK